MCPRTVRGQFFFRICQTSRPNTSSCDLQVYIISFIFFKIRLKISKYCICCKQYQKSDGLRSSNFEDSLSHDSAQIEFSLAFDWEKNQNTNPNILGTVA